MKKSPELRIFGYLLDQSIGSEQRSALPYVNLKLFTDTIL